jgi:hypothetical protein
MWIERKISYELKEFKNLSATNKGSLLQTLPYHLSSAGRRNLRMAIVSSSSKSPLVH